MTTKHTHLTAAAAGAVLLGSVLAAAPAHAGGGGDFTQETGACSMVSVWDMKAKPVARGIEMEFSVDSNRLGQAWAVRLTDNGKMLFSGNRRTRGVSRSLSLDKILTDRAGTDRLVARAVNAKTGEVCRGHVALAAAGGGGGKG
jgi:hypothetical protein